MALTTGAIRKERADKRKAQINAKIRTALRQAVAAMRKKPTATSLIKVFKTADIAAKKKVIQKNKANRLKARLTKTLVKKR